MKKSILLISTVCAAACIFSSCKSCDKKKTTVYEDLNAMLAENYSQISISINNTFTEENITLESVYTVKYAQSEITVDYSVERFAEFTLENPTTEVKKKYNGTAVIVGGIISGGEEVGLTADIARLKLDFNESYFENAEYSNTLFSADVIDASGFLGTQLTCTDMHVEAKFSEVFSSIEITYSQDGHEVKYSYVFNS